MTLSIELFERQSAVGGSQFTGTIDAVQLDSRNMERVSEWCGGQLINQEMIDGSYAIVLKGKKGRVYYYVIKETNILESDDFIWEVLKYYATMFPRVGRAEW